MKTLQCLAMAGMALMLSGCYEATLVEGRSIHRPAGYHHGNYYRGYSHRPAYSSGYRRHYDDDRVYRSRSSYYRRSPGVRVHLH